jgi:hypothetical protein
LTAARSRSCPLVDELVTDNELIPNSLALNIPDVRAQVCVPILSGNLGNSASIVFVRFMMPD